MKRSINELPIPSTLSDQNQQDEFKIQSQDHEQQTLENQSLPFTKLSQSPLIITTIHDFTLSYNKYIGQCLPGTFNYNPLTKEMEDTNLSKYTALERYNNGKYVNTLTSTMTMQKKALIAGVS
jgi:hypothetical protein